ncbi:MAG: YggS family pyridoxal phosphate-dependent enzyme [Candidatus Gastranaerophilales bacterium]|nr:YggS family pyridoxal phosphate-dependent enzyme [Candidatus Gastranaerophilales bacterium]
MDKILANYEKIKAQIVPYNPTIIAVTKYFGENQIIKYFRMGFRDFGENRVKDALEKMEKLPEEIIKNSRFHLIGHLQTNKVKHAVGSFDLIHSVDSVKLAEIINVEAEKKGIIQKILLQVNNAREEQKSGFLPEEIKPAFEKIMNLNSIKICGLMNMAPLNSSDEELHYLFGNIKQIYDDLQFEFGVELNQLSMGMSKDFKIALEEGATMIRLGRILFE